MDGPTQDHEGARTPEDVPRRFLEALNAGDAAAAAAMYEPGAVLAFPPGQVTTGRPAIRRVYEELLADRPSFAPGEPRPVLRAGDLALTSTRLADGTVTAEVARRQPDGTWLWALDQPNVLG